jgi:hypothetical protein
MRSKMRSKMRKMRNAIFKIRLSPSPMVAHHPTSRMNTASPSLHTRRTVFHNSLSSNPSPHTSSQACHDHGIAGAAAPYTSIHMRTYAYVRIRPRGKCVESTCVRTRTYVPGRLSAPSALVRTHSTAWSPPACLRRIPTISDVPRGVHALRDFAAIWGV